MEDQSIIIQKMLMQATLAANLDALKVYIPDIYEEFKSYQPQSSGAAIDENGQINLFNNDAFVYEDAKEFAKQQVALFIKDPAMMTYTLDHQEDKDIYFDHAHILKKISHKRKNDVKETLKRPIDEDKIDCVCMIGAGLGYQIEELFNQKNIINFFLCEPSKDVFYAMLHCIELRGIIEGCISLGGTFTVRIGGSSAGIINAISNMLHQQGHFNLSRMFFFRHYLSDTTTDTIKLIREIGHRWTAGWGFMEDEIISITHTLTNIQSGYKICKKEHLNNNKIATKPVFIVANGPSFDTSVEFLQKNSDNIIIVSCGTGLKALLKNNIKPDIHIEMERTASLLPYIEVIEKQQEDKDIKLKDIQIIALNTVYPKLLSRFKTPLLLTKLNDAGGKLIQQYDTLNMYAAPDYSNPTVSNTALAVVTSLGFKNLYLVGVDLGYKSSEHHHSKDSIYYDEVFNDFNDTVKADENMKVEGNFCDSVYTTDILDMSRANIEMLLQSNVEVTVSNCSDGAKIAGCTPVPLTELNSFSKFTDKTLLLEELLASSFDNKQFTVKKLDRAISNSFQEVKVILEELMKFINGKIENRNDLSEAFHLQNKLLMKLKSRDEYKVSYWLMQGTFRYFQAYIMTNSYYYDDPIEQKEFITFSLKELRGHINSLYKELVLTYNKPSKA
ncbi:motility associated factor glycosyltransferase family protein [Colwellia ponticola]|nr:6-hydroxymethylpterin diphosphokinase MptE-like protein [Colwellia ponticola]